MIGSLMKFSKISGLKAAAVLGAMAVSLAGCVVYPNNGYYASGYGYGPSYYAAPPVSLSFGYAGGGYYHGGGGYYHGGGDDDWHGGGGDYHGGGGGWHGGGDGDGR